MSLVQMKDYIFIISDDDKVPYESYYILHIPQSI